MFEHVGQWRLGITRSAVDRMGRRISVPGLQKIVNQLAIDPNRSVTTWRRFDT